MKAGTLSRWAAWPLIVLIAVYRFGISPIIHAFFPGSGCRYSPSCSLYALQSLRRFGVVRGSWLAVRRLFSCHPWGGHGHDPVPESWPGYRWRKPEASPEKEITSSSIQSSTTSGHSV